MASKKKAVKKGARSAKKSAVKKPVRKAAPKKTDLRKHLRIGDRSPLMGGVFMGIARGEKGQPDYYLVRGRYADKRMTHADALKFATHCTDGKFTDWQLPDRTDGALLYANGREEARSGWHWLKQTYAGTDAYAWCQHFRYGTQLDNRKFIELEVVLVRRVLIQ